MDELQRKGRVQPSAVQFWVLEDGRLTQIRADLPGHGSLGPLFYAFGLISADELQSGIGAYNDGALPSALALHCVLLPYCSEQCTSPHRCIRCHACRATHSAAQPPCMHCIVRRCSGEQHPNSSPEPTASLGMRMSSDPARRPALSLVQHDLPRSACGADAAAGVAAPEQARTAWTSWRG